MPTSATSYSGGDTYTSAVLAYNYLGKPAATKVTLTGEGTTLIPAAGFTTSYGYNLTGTLHSQARPRLGRACPSRPSPTATTSSASPPA
jgi:hypothetical protein